MTGDAWKIGHTGHANWNYGGDDFKDRIKNGEIKLIDPRFKNVEIGGVLFNPSTSE